MSGKSSLASKRPLFAVAKFGLVGSITTLIYFALMLIADISLGLPSMVAVSLAYSGSTIFHFLANRHFTFSGNHGPHGTQLFRYLIMWVINYLVTILVVGICIELFYLSPYIGVCISVLLTMCIGYLLSRHWVFRISEDGG